MDSVFKNPLILEHLFSFMSVSQLKSSRGVNHQWNSLATQFISQSAKVTISVCRYNIYKISYEPQSWETYFEKRVETLKNLGIANLFIQLRSNSPPNATADVNKLLLDKRIVIKHLHLDIEFKDQRQFEELINKVIPNIGTETFKVKFIFNAVEQPRVEGVNVKNFSVRNLDIEMLQELWKFCGLFSNLSKLKIEGKFAIELLNGLIREEMNLQSLKSLGISLNNLSTNEELDIFRLLQIASSYFTNLVKMEICELKDFQTLDPVLIRYKSSLKCLRISGKDLLVHDVFSRLIDNFSLSHDLCSVELCTKCEFDKQSLMRQCQENEFSLVNITSLKQRGFDDGWKTWKLIFRKIREH